MGLDVRVVKVKYTETPKEPVRSFLFELAAGDFEVGWGGGWDGNVFLEMYREDLERRAREYASHATYLMATRQKCYRGPGGCRGRGRILC